MTAELHPGGHHVIEPELLAEPHWDETKPSSISDRCKEELAGSPWLRSIAHFSNDVLDFVVRPRGTGLRAAEHDEGVVNEVEGRPGEQLVLCFEDFDHALRQLKSGELMRMVVQTPALSLYCGRVKLGLHLTGTTEDPDGADDLDASMNRLITRIREELFHLPDEHLGGDRGRSVVPMVSRSEDGFRFEAGRKALELSMEPRLRGMWPRFVNWHDLHYAAFYHDWSLVCVGDAFDHKNIGAQHLNIEPSQRRARYRDIAFRLRSDIARLRDALPPAPTSPRIHRLVLDVQEGAVYIHWLGSGTGDFILGVTLDQILVDVAERRLRMLVAELAPVHEEYLGSVFAPGREGHLRA